MSEWLLVYVLVAFVIGFISGLIYALRLYKQLEADSDAEGSDWSAPASRGIAA